MKSVSGLIFKTAIVCKETTKLGRRFHVFTIGIGLIKFSSINSTHKLYLWPLVIFVYKFRGIVIDDESSFLCCSLEHKTKSSNIVNEILGPS